jgi:predicted ATP-grasp superfamily ATP-dependent carboligase
MAGDKVFSNLLAIRTGVGAPKTIRISSLDELESAGKQLGFPLILKGARETGLGIVAKVESSESLRQTYEELMERFGLAQPYDWPLLQEFIPGWGCGFFAIYDKGECKRVFMHRRVREYPATGGASCCAESFRDPELERSGRALLDELKWHGVAMVEFRFDERDNRFKLIEINPKFWGSLELALAAGADFAGDYVRLALGEELQFTDQYKDLRFQWPLDGDFQHARAVPSQALAILRDFLNPAVANNIPWDEPALIKRRLMR